MSPPLRSYLKTTLACLIVGAIGLACTVLALTWLAAVPGRVIAALGLVVTITAALLAGSGLLVMHRYRCDARGRRDLFLQLNRSRDPAAIESATPPRISGMRRFLARLLLGHDFLVGDLVEVKSWEEIRATLDKEGRLEQLQFMAEMLPMCGRRARVFRCAHRIFDYRKSRKMRHMRGVVLLAGAVCDGSSHGGCNAACHTVWKAAWLRHVEPNCAAATLREARSTVEDIAVLRFGCQPPHYSCQLTQLHDASHPIGNRSVRNFLRPLMSGNVTPAAFIVGWLTHLFTELQQLRQGDGFPTFGAPSGVPGPEATALQAGDCVVVRSSAEIRATLNERLEHRGLGFEWDMLKHCGHRHRVGAEIRKVIDIVTGEMRTMKTPAYTLRDVHFSGERQQFNAQYEPLFWRAAWLSRAEGTTDAPVVGSDPLPDVD